MIMRLRFPVNPVKQIAAQDNSNRGEPGKDDHKRHTDLSEELKRQAAVIPHIEMKPFIYYDPGNEFHRGHEDHAPDKLQPQRIFPQENPSLYGTEHKAYAAQYKHTPMGESPEDHLKCIIDTASHSP